MNKRLIGIVCSWKGWASEIIMNKIGWKVTKSIAQVTIYILKLLGRRGEAAPKSVLSSIHPWMKLPLKPNGQRPWTVCPALQVDFCTSRFYNNGHRAFYIFLTLSAHIYWKLLGRQGEANITWSHWELSSSRRGLPGSASRFLHK